MGPGPQPPPPPPVLVPAPRPRRPRRRRRTTKRWWSRLGRLRRSAPPADHPIWRMAMIVTVIGTVQYAEANNFDADDIRRWVFSVAGLGGADWILKRRRG